MPRYDVYATRWDSPRVVEELIPARGLSFSMPLSAHGEASFSASVEPGRSFWRPSVSPVVSGLLIARDDVPVWCGWVVSEEQTGDRDFAFRAMEWGAFFAATPAVPGVYGPANDHVVFRSLVAAAQAVAGQNVAVEMGTSTGASTSQVTVNAWDITSTEEQFTQLGTSAGGPEWYFAAGGTLDSPRRLLALGDRLGLADPAAALEYVEDTTDPDAPARRRRGGNVTSARRSRESSKSATVAVAMGSGIETAQIRASATSTLLGIGWPRLTRTTSYTDVTVMATLQRHANADLAAAEGLTTGYALSTLDDDPDWTLVPRGSSVTVLLDTDVYGGQRPVGGSAGLTARVLGITVAVPDNGDAAIVQWDTATVQGGA